MPDMFPVKVGAQPGEGIGYTVYFRLVGIGKIGNLHEHYYGVLHVGISIISG